MLISFPLWKKEKNDLDAEKRGKTRIKPKNIGSLREDKESPSPATAHQDGARLYKGSLEAEFLDRQVWEGEVANTCGKP